MMPAEERQVSDVFQHDRIVYRSVQVSESVWKELEVAHLKLERLSEQRARPLSLTTVRRSVHEQQRVT